MDICPKCRKNGKPVIVDVRAVFIKSSEPAGYQDDIGNLRSFHGGGECPVCGYVLDAVTPYKEEQYND